MPEGAPNRFCRVLPGSGNVYLGSYTMTRFEHGDRMGIQPDGDYVIHPDGGAGPSGPNLVTELDTTGHVDGAPFPLRHLTSTPHHACGVGGGGLGIPIGYSIGAIDPVTGDVYSTAANFSVGSSRIIFTPGDVGPTATSTVFVDNIGNGFVATSCSDDHLPQGVTDLDFGPRSDGLSGNSLYFLDDFTDRVYEVRLANTAPICDAVPNQVVDEGELVALAASFSDPDAGDTHTATINWGDGTPTESGTVDQTADTVAGDHVYADNGVYIVTVTVTDD